MDPIAVGVSLLVLVAIAQSWLGYRLVIQNGRRLLRIEELERQLRERDPDRETAEPLREGGPISAYMHERFRIDEQYIELDDEPSSRTAGGAYAAYHRLQDEAIRSASPFPAGHYSGAGIVIVAGGPRYYTSAWVILTVLRRVVGCVLPIQLWYLGPEEMSPQMIELLRPFEVECVDAFEVRRRHPVRRLGAWECKPYAILHSRFKEVILLDADNVPLIDPARLLSSPQYRQTGAIFWPDLWRLEPERAIWEICRVPYRDEPEWESGQIVVDKERCWAPLQLTMHLNEWSDFYYQHVNGDKETFNMAWRMLNRPYSMPACPPDVGYVGYVEDCRFAVFQQHDFEGRVIFHHRIGAKLSLRDRILHIPGFPLEAACVEALRTLRRQWDGRVGGY